MNDVNKTLSSISLLSLERLDVACNEFENELKNEQQPRIEDYLRSESTQDNRLLLRELLNLEINHKRSQGMVATQAEYETRFSGHPQIVREAFSKSQDEKEPSRDYSGQLIAGRYQVGSLLGSGAFSDVYLAEDTERKLPVALKILKSNSGLDVERLLDEANLLSGLNHRNIVGAYHSGKADDTAFIAMQYINGSTLAETISSEGAMKPTKVVDLISKVCDALHFAHQQGLTHRDIKPENIIVDSNGQPYVADFGFALHESEQDLHYGDRSGTPYYRSPEQVRGEADWIDGRADLWSVGVMLYEMLTGRRPFQGDSIEEIDRQIQGRSPKPPRQIDSSIPEWLEAITLKCLSSSPENRYATASELADALRTKRHPQRSLRLVRRVVAVATAILIIAGSIAFSGFLSAKHEKAQRIIAEAERERAWEQLEKTQQDTYLNIEGGIRNTRKWLKKVKKVDFAEEAIELVENSINELDKLSNNLDQVAIARPKCRYILANELLNLGGLESLHDARQVLDDSSSLAKAEFEKISDQPRKKPPYLRLLADIHDSFGRICRTEKDRAKALVHFEQAREYREEWLRIVETYPDATISSHFIRPPTNAEPEIFDLTELDRAKWALATSCLQFGQSHRDAGDLEKAAVEFNAMLALRLELSQAHPNYSRYKQEHAGALRDLASCFIKGDREGYDKAIELTQRAVQLTCEVIEDEKANKSFFAYPPKINVAIFLIDLADLQKKAGRVDDARMSLQEAKERLVKLEQEYLGIENKLSRIQSELKRCQLFIREADKQVSETK